MLHEMITCHIANSFQDILATAASARVDFKYFESQLFCNCIYSGRLARSVWTADE